MPKTIEEMRNEISRQIKMGGGETLVDAIMLIISQRDSELRDKIEAIEVYDSGEFGGGQMTMKDTILSLIPTHNKE